MFSKNLQNSLNVLYKSQGTIRVSTRFYAKKLVSKRIYELLKREKVDWDSIKTPDEFKALCMPLDSRPLDSIKPEIAKQMKSVEQYLSPNLSSTHRTVQEELRKNEEVGSDLQQLINKIKYQESFGDSEVDQESLDMLNSSSGSDRKSQSSNSNKLLKRQRIRTARQVIEELSAVPMEVKDESVIQSFFASANSMNQSFKLENIINNVKQDDYNPVADKLKEDQEREEETTVYDPEDQEAKYFTLAEKLQQQRLEEQLARRGTQSPAETKKLRNLLGEHKQSKSRFYYKAGKGSPLYELAKYQLEEINKLEKRSVELQKERSDYDSQSQN